MAASFAQADARVHFDPIRAVQSIKLSNNYRTARSNDNFLSTVILNTYFFNNTVVHHDDIIQSPPKLYEDYQSSEDSSSKQDGDESSSSYESTSDDDDDGVDEQDEGDDSSDSDDTNQRTAKPDRDTVNKSHRDRMEVMEFSPSNSAQSLHSTSPLARSATFKHYTSNPSNDSTKTQHGRLQSMSIVRAISARGFKKKKEFLEHASSTPNPPHPPHHRKNYTESNLVYVPSRLHSKTSSAMKASKILGINTDAVILAKHNKKKKAAKHRKSNSFSSDSSNLVKHLKRSANSNSSTKEAQQNIDDKSPSGVLEMKLAEDDDDDEEEEEEEEEDVELEMKRQDVQEEEEEDYFEEDELDDQLLKFDKFKPLKRNTGSALNHNNGHLRRSQTVDLTNSKLAQHLKSPSIAVFDEHNNDISQNHGLHTRSNTMAIGTLYHHSDGAGNASAPLFQERKRSGTTMMTTTTTTTTSPRRNRLSLSGRSMGGESSSSSDVIEICFRIDRTKKGYMFIGLLPANKINNVVQPGFMFGFNEYSYSFHGYSGKLYHDKVHTEYYFAASNEKKKRNNNPQPAPIPSISGIEQTRRMDSSHNDNIIDDGSNNHLENGNEVENNSGNVQNSENAEENRNGVEEEEEEEKKESAQQHLLNGNTNTNNNHNHSSSNSNGGKKKKGEAANKKVPVLQSGDIVTIKMKLNRNSGKFAVMFCINNVEYGTAWKTIDPPLTLGVTMVGRSEQITLLSCNYRPHKNDKSCVIL
eukprot:CAMPEP_0197044024 /NCGR_PEP_ID=MMETSP1384-20130603/20174_1 /TAXON_ID=29189 /ORGANISM="Ammonia sp." /LENGTH=751 /DNA_ID=CAMNT_0042475409 /DNA_START=25 /DNA_END=2280 /DNA_ORIENTATION=-